MGIGAYETKQYVNELGGEISVESEVGRGTVFRLYLPLITMNTEPTREITREEL